MEIFEAYAGMYRYKILPGFAQFILQHHLEDFVKEQLLLGYKLNIPLLAALTSRFTNEQLIELSKISSAEYFNYLIQNKSYEQIKISTEKWLADQLEIIGKFQITARDITLINYVREQAFKKLIPLFTSSLQEALELSSEIDTLQLGANTTAIDTYINLLKDKIDEETHLSNRLIAASPAITFLFDIVHNKEIFVSGKVQEVMGYTPQELVVMGNDVLLQLTHPEDLQKVAAQLQQLVEANNDAVHQIEYRILHKDKSYRWLRTYYVIFKRDEQGLPAELLGKTFEVTAEIETAQALQKREQQLLEAQALAHIGSYEWNMRDNYSVNTPEISKIFELDHDQKFEEFMKHVHTDDLQKVRDAINQSFITGRYDCEYRYTKDGKEKEIWSLGKVEFENGKPFKMTGTVQDITEIKRMERELKKRTHELERSNKSLQQFASVASHDLKEPLRKISMFADMVLEAEENLSENSKNRLLRMQASAKSMMRMIQDILSFSILEARQQKEIVSLQDIVDDVMDLLEETIREKDAEIIFKNLPQAFIIPSQFRQVFQNMISNSLKFSKKDIAPRVEIQWNWIQKPVETLPSAFRYLQLTITDNGIGIEEEYLHDIFELFKRLHPKAEYDGSGLGLAITKRIVDNHEGMITALSKPGEGTTFTIIIPQ